MRKAELNRITAALRKLTPDQRKRVAAELASLDAQPISTAIVEGHFAGGATCPHCEFVRVIRNGHANGLQRYRCRESSKTFPAPSKDKLTDNLIAALDHSIPLIQAAADSTKVTTGYLETAETLCRGLRYGDARWSDWIKMHPPPPLKGLVLPIQAIAAHTVYLALT